jgi:MFS superfamily sulfate permease-like transporter
LVDEVEQLVNQAPTPVRWFVLDAEAMVDVDTTGAQALRQVITLLAKQDVTLAVSRAGRSFRSWMEKYELMGLIDQGRFYPTNRHAAAAFRQWSGRGGADPDASGAEKRDDGEP